jgi:UDP-N-acetylmuramoyl-tripeptide--D-alanyl-D-alanine ligase
MELSAGELARVAGGELVAGPPDARVTSWSIDSRTLGPGACFVALSAARDGHDFVDDAEASGAVAVLVARQVPVSASTAVVVVDDPLAALGRLGAHARAVLDPPRVVGITGSAGKTGTKDLTAAALRGVGVVHASPGSYNNEAGVPLTLLAAPTGAAAVVVEMGARAPGDIAALCDVARPTVGVITNIGMAHAGPLGGRAGIVRTKGELFEALPSYGLAVLDADGDAGDELAARTTARVVRVSVRAGDADVRGRDVTLDDELRASFRFESPWGSAAVRLSVHGDHQVVNALLAAAVALDAGVGPEQVAAGLESVRPAAWRMEVLRAGRGVVVLHDAYNANPSSTEAALRALAQIDTDGRRVAVLGELRELGSHSEAEHARIGRMVAELGIDELVAVGPEAEPLAAAAARGSGVDVELVADAPAALDAVLATVGPGDAVLVKGSRAVGLEQVAHALAAEGSP